MLTAWQVATIPVHPAADVCDVRFLPCFKGAACNFERGQGHWWTGEDPPLAAPEKKFASTFGKRRTLRLQPRAGWTAVPLRTGHSRAGSWARSACQRTIHRARSDRVRPASLQRLLPKSPWLRQGELSHGRCRGLPTAGGGSFLRWRVRTWAVQEVPAALSASRAIFVRFPGVSTNTVHDGEQEAKQPRGSACSANKVDCRDAALSVCPQPRSLPAS